MTLVKRAEYKIPGGKLIAAELTIEGGHIREARITGDFFMHPETAILDLEETLRGSRLDEVDSTVTGFFARGETTLLLGVSPGDFVTVIRMATESESVL